MKRHQTSRVIIHVSSFRLAAQVETFPPHLALIFGSQGLDELLHAEWSPHHNRDPLKRSDESGVMNTRQQKASMCRLCPTFPIRGMYGFTLGRTSLRPKDEQLSEHFLQ